MKLPSTIMKIAGWNSATGFALLAAIAVGVLAGIGGYTFVYAKGASYLTSDPAACANCHVMDQHYAAWQRSSHRAAAVCNDCHAPNNLVGKYVVKAENGWRHSVAFTTGRHPDPMRITPRNARVTEQACRDCHAGIVAVLRGTTPTVAELADPHREPSGSQTLSCIHCHRSVGHWVR